MAGAIVQWMRDALCLIEKASDTAALAEAADPTSNIVLVPAFTGLGAPHWKPKHARPVQYDARQRQSRNCARRAGSGVFADG